MDSIDRLNQAIRYIEENLRGGIDYKEISKITLSPISSFQRFFYLTTGMALTEYIRRRKLYCAADDLQNTNEKIIDIAMKYGYESSDAFSVAFKREYSAAPSAARQDNIKIEPFHRLFFEITIKRIKEDTNIKNTNVKEGVNVQMISNIRNIVRGELGENYPFADCMAFLMEKSGRPDIDYWVFAGVTGDSVTQIYNKNDSLYRDNASQYLIGADHVKYVFDEIGYEHTYVAAEQINANKTMYIQTLMAYIDKGVPVIAAEDASQGIKAGSQEINVFLIVGYEDGGKTLLVHLNDSNKIKEYETAGLINQDWIFIGEKKSDISVDGIIKNAVFKMNHWLTLPERGGVPRVGGRRRRRPVREKHQLVGQLHVLYMQFGVKRG